ncbi:hypothetical protein M569_14936 [Genlisea aurea]|uniref:Uncharacterized protein n=1 Tax=Genlisea aurea TaxID=192259 RepID=S8BZR8_9LAMI|nr:hypothetical protein M569_14936 [Genlisea aurea]
MFAVIIAALLIFLALARNKWKNAAEKKEEIFRLLAMASEEEAELEKREKVDGFIGAPASPLVTQPQQRYYCALCYSPAATSSARNIDMLWKQLLIIVLRLFLLMKLIGTVIPSTKIRVSKVQVAIQHLYFPPVVKKMKQLLWMLQPVTLMTQHLEQSINEMILVSLKLLLTLTRQTRKGRPR